MSFDSLSEAGKWLLDNVLSNITPEEFVRGVTGPGNKDYDPSRTRTVLTAFPEGRSAHLEPKMYAPDGTQITQAPQERSLYEDSDGTPTVKNDYFFLKDEYKASGTGGAVIRLQLSLWKKLGFKKVKLSSVRDGRFVWPRMGFKPDLPTNPRKLARAALLQLVPSQLRLGWRDLTRPASEPAPLRTFARTAKKQMLASKTMTPAEVGRTMRGWLTGDISTGSRVVVDRLSGVLADRSAGHSERQLAWGEALQTAAEPLREYVEPPIREVKRSDSELLTRQALRSTLQAYSTRPDSGVDRPRIVRNPRFPTVESRAAEVVARKAWDQSLESTNMTLNLDNYEDARPKPVKIVKPAT